MKASSSPSSRQHHGRISTLDRLFILLSGITIGFLTASFVFFCVISSPNEESVDSSHSIRNDPAWNEIHVFTGDDEKIRHDQLVSSSAIPQNYYEKAHFFSQVRQDELILRLLRYQRKGFFVDLAANDAIRISNTYIMERDYGWNGIAIEPNPIYWSGLVRRPRSVIVAAVVGGSDRTVQNFRFPKDKAPQGGIVGKQEIEKHPKEVQVLPTVSLQEILERFKAPEVIDYFSLDCEGAETLVLENFPFHRYTFRLLTIERPDEKLNQLLQDSGYRQLKRLKSWGETLWAHGSVVSRLDLSALELDTEHYKYSEKE